MKEIPVTSNVALARAIAARLVVVVVAAFILATWFAGAAGVAAVICLSFFTSMAMVLGVGWQQGRAEAIENDDAEEYVLSLVAGIGSIGMFVVGVYLACGLLFT